MAFITSPFLFFRRDVFSKRSRGCQPRFTCVKAHDVDSNSLLKTLPTPIRIALTREKEKNKSLHDSLCLIYPNIEIVTTPCVETAVGEDAELLPQYLRNTPPNWIIITSPEAASVFINGWRKADYPALGKLAVVGKATGDTLRAVGLDISFQPSKATGKTLVAEFPSPSTEGETVLYPASAKAADVIVDGLSKQRYSVTRLNTYSTETVSFDETELELAEGTHIVTFASPSAVKGWVTNVGVSDKIAVTCIGETSAKAARKEGFQQVHYPEKPGMEGWVSAISEAMKLFEQYSK